MSNPVVTALCAWAICLAIMDQTLWVRPILAIALTVAIWNNVQWAKVFQAAAKILEAARK
ncbi:MAG TPA: hypothetical protein VK899_01905 [Gemmatimonadales bacterium]|nr:hypothetical protein [Gemmatimonadales bacterium]